MARYRSRNRLPRRIQPRSSRTGHPPPALRILALGPLTSVAMALRLIEVVADPAPDMVDIGWGGERAGQHADQWSGPVPAAEWNIGVDPVAADEVLRSGLARSWVAVDASNDVPAEDGR